MSLEDGLTATAEPVAEPTPATTAVPTTPVYVNPDGTFTEKWRESLPEDIRAEASLNTFKNIQDVAKQAVYLKKQFGKDKIVLPNEKSLPQEWNTFYDTIGRPKDKSGYEYKPADDIKEHIDSGLLDIAKERFYKAGLNQKQANEILALNEELLRKGLKAQEEQANFDRVAAEGELRDKWKDKYDARLHIANRLIAENTDSETKDALLAKIGNDPMIADFFATIGTKFMEHKSVLESNTNAPYELDQKINELMRTDAYTNRNNLDHKIIVDRVQALFQQKEAMKK